MFILLEKSSIIKLESVARKEGANMAEMLTVAKYFNELNLAQFGENMDQMKMHKMMYFSQRESLMLYDKPLFDDVFQAWKFGPVLPIVRKEYTTGSMFAKVKGMLTLEEKDLVQSVYKRYVNYSAWDLSTLSHVEVSWKNAREGLRPEQVGKRPMRLSDIKVDATKERLCRLGVVLS